MQARNLKLFILFILFILSYYPVFLNTYSLDATNLKTKILVVALEEPDKRTITSLEEYGPEYVKAYNENIEGLNKIIEEKINSIWTFNQGKKFLNKKEAQKLFKSDKSKYALMIMEESIPELQTFNFASNSNKPPLIKGWYLDKEKFLFNYSSRYYLKSLNVSKLSIYSPKEIIQVNLLRKYLSEGDIIYAISSLQTNLS